MGCVHARQAIHFYPRPPRGGRPRNARSTTGTRRFLSTPSARRATPAAWIRQPERHISIHALREEGDLHEPPPQAAPSQFLSTPSARRATVCSVCTHSAAEISIHALREEGDMQHRWKYLDRLRFLSTPSARRATFFLPRLRQHRQFLSTPSARRATHRRDQHPYPQAISIHALREEGDITALIKKDCHKYFYPRPPRGGRLQGVARQGFVL